MTTTHDDGIVNSGRSVTMHVWLDTMIVLYIQHIHMEKIKLMALQHTLPHTHTHTNAHYFTVVHVDHNTESNTYVP